MRTIGEILQKARSQKNVSLDEVEKTTKIRKKFLHALEENNFELFPGSTYAKGFVKNYSEYLGLRPDAMLALYRRQVDEWKRGALPSVGFVESKFRLTPRLFLIAVSVISLAVFVGYLVYEYQTYAGVPQLEVVEPADGKVVDNDTITVSGRTTPESTVSINNQIVTMAPDGSFLVEVTLQQGDNTLAIVATNAFGKKRTVERRVRRE